MPIYHTLFYLLAILVVGTTAVAITRRELVHAVVWLVGSFLGTALLFYLLGAPLLAALEVIIYAGAIMVLFLFVIMTSQERDQQQLRAIARPLLFVIGIDAALVLMIARLLRATPASLQPLAAATAAPRDFGRFLFTRYWLAVEIVSLLLFVALVGALYLSREKANTQQPAVGQNQADAPREVEP